MEGIVGSVVVDSRGLNRRCGRRDILLGMLAAGGSVGAFSLLPTNRLSALASTFGWTFGWQPVVSPQNPPARAGSCLAYDPVRGVLVLVGGTNVSYLWTGPVVNSGVKILPSPVDLSNTVSGSSITVGGVLSDTWQWDGTQWTQSPAAGPSAAFSTLSYDWFNHRLVLFGGVDVYESANGEMWFFDGSVWSGFVPPVLPSARARAAMASDPVTKTIVLFGGHGPNGLLGDTWLWNGTSWAQVGTAGPSPRLRPCAAYDEGRQQIVLFGGYDGTLLTDTWVWSASAGWSLAAVDGPAAEGAAMAYDAASGHVVLVGGQNRQIEGVTADTWAWDGGSWSLQSGSLGALTPRRDAACGTYGTQGVLLNGGDQVQLGYAMDSWALA